LTTTFDHTRFCGWRCGDADATVAAVMMNRLGVCIVGLNGAVASTLVAGAALLRRKLTAPLALVSEPFRPILRFAGFDEMVFAGWDPRGETSLAAARRNRVLDAARLAPVAKELARLTPWPAPGGRAAPHPNGSAGASPSNGRQRQPAHRRRCRHATRLC
jgi:myo-inositol-1-phosphate synthase